MIKIDVLYRLVSLSCDNAVVSKTKHSETKTEARSAQISKTKHPKLENEALENEAPIENEALAENEEAKTRNHCRLN